MGTMDWHKKNSGHPWKLSPALNFCAARKMRGRPGHAEACRATKDRRVPNNSRCMVARCLPREVANILRKVAQFNRPIFQNNLFKSSPNVVVSLTGATASRLSSSCQSTHLLQAFVQRKTRRNFEISLSKSRYGSQIFANFAIFEFFSKV